MKRSQINAIMKFCLAFLEERAGDAATSELLKAPGLVQDVRKAKRLIAAGKGVNWRTVRKDV